MGVGVCVGWEVVSGVGEVGASACVGVGVCVVEGACVGAAWVHLALRALGEVGSASVCVVGVGGGGSGEEEADWKALTGRMGSRALEDSCRLEMRGAGF